MTGDDRHAAFCAGYELGMAERLTAEIEDRARALLHTWADESRDMAKQYAAVKGPNWAAMVTGEVQ